MRRLGESAVDASKLFKKIYGCIIGGAIGDAMGIPVEMMHYEDIEDQFGRVTTFVRRQRKLRGERPFYETMKMDWRARPRWQGWHPYGAWGDEPGTYTDDMRFRLLGYQAIIDKGGRITGRDFAHHLYKYGMNSLGIEEFGTTYNWEGPQKEWAFPWGGFYAGMSSLGRIGPLLDSQKPFTQWDAPCGVINACDPRAAAQDGLATAVAVAEAMKPDATPDSVVGAVLDHPECAPGRLGGQLRGRLSALLEVAVKCNDVFELRRPFYDRFLVPYGVSMELEMIPFALAVFLVAKGDPKMTIIGAVNVGRDADTIACTAGEIAGAFAGYDAIPAEWAETVQQVNPEPAMNTVAEQLTEVVEKNLAAKRRIVEDLQRLL